MIYFYTNIKITGILNLYLSSFLQRFELNFISDISFPCGRDAWSKLGEMSREEAMMNYVEELKKVISFSVILLF